VGPGARRCPQPGHRGALKTAVTPDRLLGRMTASYRFLTYGAIPLGALLGGVLGELLGLRAAVAVGPAGPEPS
jgi:hypothetical protein